MFCCLMSVVEGGKDVFDIRVEGGAGAVCGEGENLSCLHVEMEEVVYVPDTRIVLHDVDEEERMFHLLHHSEKLAIAFGLISSPPGTPISFFKNL